IGFFVNTLVMRTDLSGDPSFEELLARVREVALEAYVHQDLPFETLVEELQPQRDLSHTPLFQVMFVLDTAGEGTLELPGLTLSTMDVGSGAATFDLTLSITSGPAGLGGYIEYNTDLFGRATIERLVGHFQTLLQSIVTDPEQPISNLSILTEVERQQLLVEWNETAVDFPADVCIHHLFEVQAEQCPQAIATIFAGPPTHQPTSPLTYQQLNCRANQLAHYLQKLGVGPEVLVGISTERSLEMVVGIMGILKAGGAYLPLDPTYPPERLVFMIEDANIPVLLTQSHLLNRLPLGELANQRVSESATRITDHESRITICLDTDWELIAQESRENPESGATAESLAYVIYTSGSTGLPKGTMLRHRGLCNLTDVQRRAFNIREGSRVLQFSPLSFDASVWETFMALRNGATLCLSPQETLASGPGLARLMREEKVTNVTLPPSVLAVLPEGGLPDLETVISAGEACTPELVARWSPGRDFFNAYGPTETTVCASMYLCDENDPHSPPIGRPIDNTRLYILDQNLQPVPVGVPGELLVGGVSLARGYLNRPELTKEKFIPDPFAPSYSPPARGGGRVGAESRLYRTGDLVRYRADGNIEFLGRIDHQVKVRGFRIELGEIEAVLEQHPEVQDGVVVVREDAPGDKRLVAYLVPMNEVGPSVGELRSFLRQTLPEYMVPSAFVTLGALPLSPSGKVDRRALPEPEGVRPEMEREYVPPRNETEEKLAVMCAELLGVDRVGIYDSFFDLGGHSLLATQFISRVRDAFEVELPLRTLFEHPNVAELTEALERARERGTELQAPAILPVSREDHRVRRSAL
ncbi:MAG: amino acid adenylation domain-containing protein, partial [Chloroflexota bacterium]|nr:amino acid adenylation domain-containing protein [Chloroflexota bacterium]